MKQQENIRIYFTHINAKASNSVDTDNFTILTILIVRLSYFIIVTSNVCKLLYFLIQKS